VQWPTEHKQLPVLSIAGNSMVGVKLPLPVPFLCWLQPDLVKKKLKALVAEQADPNGITEADRQARLARLEKTLVDLGRVEEATIEAAEAAGESIERRSEADYRCVLALSSELPRPVEA
jgi:hypothetical protein